MGWINVHNPSLSRFYYEDYGMKSPALVTENGKANVSAEAEEQLVDHPSGDFSVGEPPEEEPQIDEEPEEYEAESDGEEFGYEESEEEPEDSDSIVPLETGEE